MVVQSLTHNHNIGLDGKQTEKGIEEREEDEEEEDLTFTCKLVLGRLFVAGTFDD